MDLDPMTAAVVAAMQGPARAYDAAALAALFPRASRGGSMQHYQCHKVVEAAKVVVFNKLEDGSARLRLEGPPHAPREHWILVTPRIVAMMQGASDFNADLGYYIRYEDGYESWSPTKAFEAGYTLVALVGFTADQLREILAIASVFPGTVEDIHNRWVHQKDTDGWRFGNTTTAAHVSSYLRAFHDLAPEQQGLLRHELSEVAEEEALEGPARMEPPVLLGDKGD